MATDSDAEGMGGETMGRMEREGKVLLWKSRVDVMRWIEGCGEGGGERGVGQPGSMSVTVPVEKEEGVRGGWRCDRND